VLDYAIAVSAVVRGQQDVRRVTRFIPAPRAVRLHGRRLGMAQI
jgi:hypothetical protein